MHFVLTLRGTQGTTEGDRRIMSYNVSGIPLTVKVTKYDRSGNNIIGTETKPFTCRATKPADARAECIAFGESFSGPGVNDIEVFNAREELVWFAETGI